MTQIEARTMAHALELVIAAHRARLGDVALTAAESIARQEGATRDQVQQAVARGVSV